MFKAGRAKADIRKRLQKYNADIEVSARRASTGSLYLRFEYLDYDTNEIEEFIIRVSDHASVYWRDYDHDAEIYSVDDDDNIRPHSEVMDEIERRVVRYFDLKRADEVAAECA